MAKIRFLDQVPIGVFETPTNTTNGSFSGSFTGSFFGTASWSINALTASFLSGSVANAISASYALTASFALNAGGGSNISGAQYFVPLFNSTSSLITSSIFQSGSFTSIRNATTPFNPSNPDILYINGDGINTYNLMSAHTDIDSYAQINVQNFNPGATASSDVVATADIGGENDHYIDMGINGSGYNDPLGIGLALDAYLYSTGQDLLIGNKSGGNKVIIFNGDGPALDNARVFIDSIGTVGINASDPTVGNPEALLVEAINNTTYNLIRAKGSVNNFLQTAIVNSNTGSAASADIVAYNNLDPNSSAFGFIDMGINSSNFDDPINFPGWTPGDGYLYTDSSLLRIGSSNTGNSTINFFIGANPTSGSRFKINSTNQHEMTGSLNVSGSITAFSFTGSFQGTASFASSSISASYALTASYVLNAVSSSYASSSTSASYAFNSTSASYAATASIATSASYALSSSYAVSSSYALNSTSASYALTASFVVTAQTASYVLQAVSASFASTASYVLNAVSASFASTASRATSASYALSASFAPTNTTGSFTGSFTGSLLGTASYATNALSASYFSGSIDNAISASYAATASIAISSSYPVSVVGNNILANLFDNSSITPLNTINSVYIGNEAGGNMVNTGSWIVAIGDNAGKNTVSPLSTVFIGEQAGNSAISASYSNFIGTLAGALSTSPYSNFIGFTAGAFTNSSHSLHIGYQTGLGNLNNNNIILGTNITLPSGIDSGLNIGGVLFGRNLFFDDVSSTAFDGTIGNGKIGINVVDPQYNLDVSGSGNYTNGLTITGSLNAPSITGSLLGSASYALTASFALNGGGGAAFPFTGSAVITGSLIVTGTIALGDPTAPAVYTSIKTTVNSGSTVIYNVLTSSYDSAFFDYSLKGSTGARAGNIMAIWSGSSVSYTDNSTADMGNTTDFVFGVILSGSNMVLTGSTSTNGWTLKTAIRTI